MRIDWLEGTISKRPISDILHELQRYFCGFDWQELDRGAMGYTHSALVAVSGRVYWNPERVDMGVHVSLPSTALDQLGMSSESVLRDLRGMGFKCSRLDIAADDFDGNLSLSVIREKVLRKEIVFRAQKVSEDRDLLGGSGNTIYFGKRGSRSVMRIYDKSAQQADLHKGVFTHWTRAELELRGERAEAAARVIAANWDTWHEIARGWFLAFLDFKEPGLDSNKSRWVTCAWWSIFLDNAVKIRLVLDPQVRSVDTVKTWVVRQVSPSLSVLGQTIGYQELFQIVLDGGNRLSERHEKIIDDYARMLESIR